MQLNYHPAPGMGDLLPGFFVVPQNPITQPTQYIPRISEILPGAYVVPQNPVKDFTRGQTKLIGQGVGCGTGCGCGSSTGKINGIGMGDLSSDWAAIQANVTAGDYMAALQSPVMGFPVWGIAAVFAALMFVGGEKHSYAGRGRRAARAAAGAF